MTQDKDKDGLAISFFSEVLAADHIVRGRLGQVMPKGMEISHFSVLHNLARHGEERTPAALAATFNVTRAAMTNTLSKLEWAGYIHIWPDWDDARRKLVAISPAGVGARDAALAAIVPLLRGVVDQVGQDQVRSAIPALRALRNRLSEKPTD